MAPLMNENARTQPSYLLLNSRRSHFGADWEIMASNITMLSTNYIKRSVMQRNDG